MSLMDTCGSVGTVAGVSPIGQIGVATPVQTNVGTHIPTPPTIQGYGPVARYLTVRRVDVFTQWEREG